MSEINTAVERLKQARDILANKIAEKVNEGGDDFAEDFTAGGYRGSEADELMELGERFYKLTYLIAAMPVEREPFVPASDVAGQFYNPNLGEPYSPPRPDSTWDEFVRLCGLRDLSAASDQLRGLLRIDLGLAMRATAHFGASLKVDHDGTISRLKHFTDQPCLTANGTLKLLYELFNIQGDTAVSVCQRLKADR